jgi:diguanylate cyclase (GGDEF)-like protein
MHLLARYRTLLAVANARRHMLEEIAFVDPLTGLSNRRRLYEVMATELSRCHETGRPCSFVLWDIDHFKRINDAFGHQMGDRVLREVASIAQRAAAQPEWVGRWGGEEFLFVLPQSSLADAASFAERFRQQINQAVVLPDWPITSSYGVTVYREGEAIEATLHRADQALYQAKRSGRDRVEVMA